MYIATDETGRIGASTPHEQYAKGMEQFDFPEDFDFAKQNEYRIVDGQLVHDPPPPHVDFEAEREELKRRQMDTAAMLFVRMTDLDDATAYSVSELHEEWAAKGEDGRAIRYEKDDRRLYDGRLWRCLQPHDSQEGWNPAAAPSLWAEILPGQQGEVGEWKQPESTNPYMKGDRVTHKGKTWESTIDNNVWEPGAAGTGGVWIELA